MKYIILFLLLFPGLLLSQSIVYDFSDDENDWEGIFTDYPHGSENFYQLDFQITKLPLPLDTNKNAAFIMGSNHSDDLFMGIKKKIDGLLPNCIYEVSISVEFASDVATNLFGAGGAPGEGLHMKTGIIPFEPDTVHMTSAVLLNLDKGNQANPGSQLDTIGHIGVHDTTTVYAFKSNTNESHKFVFETNSEAEAWFLVGTDSGFEGITRLYYNKITLNFSLLTSIEDRESKELLFYPNPSRGNIFISKEMEEIQIYNSVGEKVIKLSEPGLEIDLDIENGSYIIVFKDYLGKKYTRKIIIRK